MVSDGGRRLRGGWWLTAAAGSGRRVTEGGRRMAVGDSRPDGSGGKQAAVEGPWLEVSGQAGVGSGMTRKWV